MQLIHSPPSPFARKVRIVLHEKGVAFDEMLIAPPYDTPALQAANPTRRIPTLVLDDGEGLYDSTTICAWLEAHYPAPALLPGGEDRWRALKLEALGDALAENAIKILLEGRRPAEQQSDAVVARSATTCASILDALEAAGSDAPYTLGEIAVGCALAYLDFRVPQLDWRRGRPNLVARLARLTARPSFKATAPDLA